MTIVRVSAHAAVASRDCAGYGCEREAEPGSDLCWVCSRPRPAVARLSDEEIAALDAAEREQPPAEPGAALDTAGGGMADQVVTEDERPWLQRWLDELEARRP